MRTLLVVVVALVVLGSGYSFLVETLVQATHGRQSKPAQAIASQEGSPLAKIQNRLKGVLFSHAKSSDEIRALLADDVRFRDIVREGFEIFDTDTSKHVDREEFTIKMMEILAIMGLGSVTRQQIYLYFGQFDADRSGKLTLDEFEAFYRSFLEGYADSLDSGLI